MWTVHISHSESEVKKKLSIDDSTEIIFFNFQSNQQYFDF